MAVVRGGKSLRIVLLLAVVCFTMAKEKKQWHHHRKMTAAENVRFDQLWAKYGPDYSAKNQQTEEEFPCNPLPKSKSVPTSVHALRPADVNVIGALGDSLTAGNGITAKTVIGVLIENRGLTWSGGGQTDYEDQITLPNILKKYNPEVYGYATGNGDENSRRSHLNVAVSGSVASDLVDQARELVKRMKNDPKVDLENDWKVVTILSGNNDLCDYCDDPEKFSTEKFREHVEAALDILQAELPRTLVNLVEPLNVGVVRELNKGLICSALHFFGCECAAFPRNEEAEREIALQANLYQLAANEIATSGRYDTKDDFTVVSQPFFNNTYLPRTGDNQPDMSYFAPDCFHFSRKGHSAGAVALWNNMIQPVSRKANQWSPGETLQCPTEAQPYFFTNKNSNVGMVSSFHKERDQADDTKPTASGTIIGAVIGVSVFVGVAVIVLVVVVVKKKHQRFTYDRI